MNNSNNQNNNFYSLEDKNKIKSSNIYHALQDIEKKYPPLDNLNDIDNTEDYVPYHIVGIQKKKYLHINGLTELFHKMSKQTRTECCPLMFELSNVIYIDLDYKIINNENEKDLVEKFNKDITKGIINDFKSIISENNSYNYVLLFPSEIKFDQKERYYKCGAHCFVFFDSNIPKDLYKAKLFHKLDNNQELIELLDNFKDLILVDNIKELKVSSLIDESRFINNGSMIFPLAQKDVNSRQYKIDEGDLSKIKIPKQQSNTRKRDKDGNLTYSYNIDNFKEEVVIKALKDAGYKTKTKEEKNEIYCITKNICWIYRMINSLAYLSDNHPLIKKFSKGNWFNDKNDPYNAGKFTTIVYKLTLLLIFLGGKLSKNIVIGEPISNIIFNILSNLFAKGGKTNFDDIKNSVYNHINYINNLNKENNNEEGAESLNAFIELLTTENIHYSNRDYILADLKDPKIKKSCKDNSIDIETINELKAKFSEETNKVLVKLADYIETQVINHLTNELLPFKEKNITRDIFEFSFQDLNKSEKDKTFYEDTIKNMFELFLFCKTIHSRGTRMIQDSYTLVKTFMQYFIAFIDENDKNGYIYNVKQNNDICNQPYNQWISFSDSSNSSVKIWIKHLYENTYMKIFKNTITNDRSFMEIINEISKNTNILEKINTVRLLSNDDKSINTIVGEIYKQNLFNTEHKLEKILPHGSEYFAVFNGIIEYKQINGKYVVNFLKVNENRISESCTYACYDPNYNIDNEYYRTIMEVFHETYPDDEDREYMMKLFSSTVCPIIDKDVCVFAYGGGADGKTTIDKILLCALGSTGNSNGIKRDGEILRVVKGHGTTIDTTVFTSPKSRGSADEGGLASLNGRTFAVMQEPIHNTPIISSNIKEITGIGGIRAREIYKNSDEFINNALVICETNQLPTFDVIDQAIQRRVVVYQHEVKFFNKSNKDLYSKVSPKYIKPADPNKIKKIESDPRYWDALIYILVQKALELLNQGISSLENIERPDNIRNTTELTFTKGSNIISWLKNNTYQITDTNINCRWSFVDFFKLIKDEDENNVLTSNKKGNNQKIFNTDNEKNKAESLVNAINTIYGSHFYKIKTEYMLKDNVKEGRYYENLDHILDEEKNKEIINMSNKEFMEKYTDGNALINIEKSNFNNYKDIVILDIDFNQEMKDRHEFN